MDISSIRLGFGSGLASTASPLSFASRFCSSAAAFSANSCSIVLTGPFGRSTGTGGAGPRPRPRPRPGAGGPLVAFAGALGGGGLGPPVWF